MKNIYPLLIITCLVFVFSSCTKDNKSANTAGQLAGKWQETTLTLHQVIGGDAVRDTSFTSVSFLPGDFYQFNTDNTAVISQSGVYAFGGKVSTIDGGTTSLTVNHYKYSVADNMVTLTFTAPLTTPNNIQEALTKTESIVLLDDTHLILSTYASNANIPGASTNVSSLTTIAYFTRVK